MTAEFRSLFLRNLRTMVGYAQGNNDHVDLEQSRIAKDEQDVKAMVAEQSVPSRGDRLPTIQKGTPRARETTREVPSYTEKAKVKDPQ